MSRAFDIVIFGASGFSGWFVVKEMAMNAPKENINWAVAGRNLHKVQHVLEETRKSSPDTLQEIEILEADVTDQNALDNMCKRAKLIINCVGPYEKYGDAVVMACLKNKTHLVDMSVEIMYISRIILQHYHEAESQEVYIITACGVGYLPVEMGMSWLQQRFEGGISTVDCHVNPSVKPESVHFGTWESYINMGRGFYEMIDARQKMYSRIMKRHQSKWNIILPSWPIKFTKVGEFGLYVPSMFHTAQLSVDMQQDNFYKRPTKVNVYLGVKSWFALIQALVSVFLLICLFPFSFGKRLLLKHAELFSFGVVTKSDTSARRDLCRIRITAVVKGWRKKQHDDQEPIENPDTTAVASATGPPAYKTTAICLVQSAFTVLKETKNLPNRGGVYTPLAAFSETSLLSRLCDHGIEYQLKDN